MEREPKRFVIRLLEVCAGIALGAFLLWKAVQVIQEIWWILLIIAGVIVVAVIGYRIWKNHIKW